MLVAAPDARSADATTVLAGRYSEHFINADIQGNRFGSDNIVEIVPIGGHAAYLRVELAFFNYHTCSILGIGKAVGRRIVYYDHSDTLPSDRPPCVLTVSRRGTDLLIEDDLTCKAYCGERGGLTGITVPFASRRPIRYLARLKSTRDFTDALQAWRAQRGGTPG